MTAMFGRWTSGGGRRGPGRGRAVAVVAALSCAVVLAISGVASAVPGTGAGAAAAARIRWGKAELVPGLAALNKGVSPTAPTASVNAISCWGAGGCVIGGFYTDGHDHVQAFVARERKSRWAKAIEVPGTAALNKGGNAQVGQVSCARTSVCVAVGTYTNKAGSGQWFTVTERNGRWGTATQVPYPTLNQASISTVWCAPGGLCAAAGTFTDSAGASDAWVRTEVKGRWQPALAVPGLAALNAVGNGAPGVSSVVCASAGNCAAGGLFNESPTTNLPVSEAFVVTQTNGTWGSAEEMPGIQTVNQGQAGTSLVTCPSAGNCFAGGYYAPVNMDFCDVTNCRWAFVVNERHGKWDNVNLPNEFIVLSALTCPATGDCVAVGQFIYGPNADTAGELLSETNDRWATPQILYSVSGASSVSCASPGYCAAGGQNVAGSAFVISQWHGTWGKAVTPAGILDRYSSITAMACPPKITLCIAGGNETPAGSIRSQPFIVSQTG